MHPACLPPSELARQCDELRTRRGGPGGQHRNKVETAVVLIHRPTGIRAEAAERRSQAENRAMALRRLRLKLALEHREPAGDEVSDTWRRRVRGRTLVVSAGHADLPALIAEALDRLSAAGWHVPPAALKLGVSNSQLAGLLRKAPTAWTAFNTFRVQAGLPALGS